MRPKPYLGTRIFLSFCVVLVLTLIFPAWYYYRTLSLEIQQITQSRILEELNILYEAISHDGSLTDEETLKERIMVFANSMGARITYVDTAGKIVADSQIPLQDIPTAENFATRPEILQTHDNQPGLAIRSSRLLGGEYLYAARKAKGKGSIPDGIIRVAMEYSNTRNLLGQLKYGFMAVSLIVIFAVAFVCYVLIRQLSSPIQDIITATEAIRAGNFNQRVHLGPDREFYPLAEAINRMAEDIDIHTQSITKEMQQLESVFNGMKDGIMVLDSKGKIMRINRTLSRLVTSRTQSIGRRPLDVFLNLELQEACDRFLDASRDFEEPCTFQVVMGEARTFHVNIVKLQDGEREAQVIVVFHDITELKHLTG